MAKLTEWQEYILEKLGPTGRIKRHGWFSHRQWKWRYYYEIDSPGSKWDGLQANGNAVRGLVAKGVLVFDEKNSTQDLSFFTQATQAKK